MIWRLIFFHLYNYKGNFNVPNIIYMITDKLNGQNCMERK